MLARDDLAAKTWADLNKAGVRIAVPQASSMDKFLTETTPNATIQRFPGNGEAIAAFQAAGVARSEPVLKSPFASTYDGAGNRISTPFMADAASATTFWLAYMMQPPPTPGEDGAPRTSRNQAVAVARYRLAVEDGKPVVRVGIVCERAADECDRLRAFLLKGLPIAKPPR